MLARSLSALTEVNTPHTFKFTLNPKSYPPGVFTLAHRGVPYMFALFIALLLLVASAEAMGGLRVGCRRRGVSSLEAIVHKAEQAEQCSWHIGFP